MRRASWTVWRPSLTALLALGAGLLLAGVALASEAAHGEHGAISPAKIQDFTWRTVNFVVFAAALIYLLRKPAKAFFAQRTQEVAQTLDELEAKKNAAEAALKEAEARLAAAAAERDKIIQQYMAEGEMEKAKILEKAEQVAARIKEMAQMTIEQETKKAAQNLKQEVVDRATQMARELIQEKATPDDQHGLVEEYLKKVETH